MQGANTGADAPSDPTASGNIMLSLRSAKIITRSSWDPPSLPATASPRLYGADSVWIPESIQPFYDAPCEFTQLANPGFGWTPGVPDFKYTFEVATLGYSACYPDGNRADSPASYTDHECFRKSYGLNKAWDGSFSGGSEVRIPHHPLCFGCFVNQSPVLSRAMLTDVAFLMMPHCYCYCYCYYRRGLRL